MGQNLKLRTFRYCDPPRRGEGLRIGTTRRPPRGVTRDRWQAEGYFDVWFPSLAPKESVLRRFQGKIVDQESYRAFCRAYEKKLLGSAEGRQAVKLIAAIAVRTPISIGCFCENESFCHRNHLAKIIHREARST